MQSNQFVASKKGDSSFQAAYRAHSQQQHQDKAAQLLPGRWEQLSDYDAYHLAHQLYDHPSIDKKLSCLVGLMLATGRDLETVLGAHVVRGLKQVPKKIDHQDLYVTRTADEWYAGILRPESARKINSQWQGAMRPTLDKLPLPISTACQALIAPHARHASINVKKRSQPLFKESTHQQLSDSFSQLLSTVNRKAGARLTEKRLSLHLFNMLNMGEADLAATCLITARMPTSGQQSSLYYYAPAVANLTQQYTAAMQRIEQPLSIALDTDTRTENAQPAIEPAVLTGYIGSQMVPTAHYVNELVAHLLQQQREVKKQPCLSQQLTEFHNAYTAYTIAMLMFCTGYRSIRDPLPKLAHISLSRGVIVIADKTNDHQSNARFLPLPPLMIEQFRAYLKHRHAITIRLDVFLGLDWETPFLFLSTYGKPQQATPARLENHLQWPQSPPLNINRHYLHTQLKECGCSAEIVDALMGHWNTGQEPWAKYSTFCPREYRQRITSRVEDMMRKQGWAVIEGTAL